VLRGIGLFSAIVFILFLLASFVLFLVALRPEPSASSLFTWDWTHGLFASKVAHVLFGAVFGCVGGIISLLLRLPEFEILKNRSLVSAGYRGNTALCRRRFCIRFVVAYFGQNHKH
jgi:hypothetical protein